MTVSISMSMQCLKLIKEILKNVLADNVSKKVTTCANATSRAELTKDRIDSWLSLTSSFEGDIIMVSGGMESKVKLLSVTTFAADMPNPRDLIDNDRFYTRVLIVASSCIGAGLDSSSAFSVMRVGFPASVIDIIQEMGRYGRTRNGNGTSLIDNFFCFSPCKISHVLMNDRVT